MENEKYLKNNITINNSTNDFDFDANKYDLNSLSILPKTNDEYPKDESLFMDDNDFLESDEYDYDSDCSLESMNSLYLHLKDNRTFQNSSVNEKQLLYRNRNYSKTDDITTNNLVTRTHILEVGKFNDNEKDTKSKRELSAVFFYGNQEPITQHIHTKLFYGRQRKNIYMNLKTIKTKYTICKFKHKVHKLRISLNNRHHRKHSLVQQILENKNTLQKNENLLRYKLKEHIPFLQLRGKIKIKISQKSGKYTNLYEKFSEDKKDFVTDRKTINDRDCYLEYCNIENRIPDLKSFFINDFMDSNDFSAPKVVENIINKLFDEDDQINDNETIQLKNKREYVDFLHQNNHALLLKTFNNVKIHD